MPDALEVDLNDDGPHSIEAPPSTVEVGGDFDVVLRNHGTALHVHLAFDDALAPAADLPTANHYVDEDAVRRVRVRVDGSRAPAEGKLKVVTGYGAETAFVTVRVVDPGTGGERVPVDESLAEPRPRGGAPLVDPGALSLIALGAVAVLIAALAVLLVSETAVLVAILAGIAVLAAAAALVVR